MAQSVLGKPLNKAMQVTAHSSTLRQMASQSAWLRVGICSLQPHPLLLYQSKSMCIPPLNFQAASGFVQQEGLTLGCGFRCQTGNRGRYPVGRQSMLHWMPLFCYKSTTRSQVDKVSPSNSLSPSSIAILIKSGSRGPQQKPQECLLMTTSPNVRPCSKTPAASLDADLLNWIVALTRAVQHNHALATIKASPVRAENLLLSRMTFLPALTAQLVDICMGHRTNRASQDQSLGKQLRCWLGHPCSSACRRTSCRAVSSLWHLGQVDPVRHSLALSVLLLWAILHAVLHSLISSTLSLFTAQVCSQDVVQTTSNRPGACPLCHAQHG